VRSDVELASAAEHEQSHRLLVRKAKSQAGTGRRPPIAEPLRPILLGEYMRQGRREGAAVSAVSVMSGKLAERARKRWAAAGFEPITLHECRHTYASFLMAAG
jgi:integrase